MKKVQLLLVLVVLCSTGCYHAIIDTGLQPSGQVVEKKWASGFLAGLVPPSTVETASKCPNGVAKVETQMSFVNQLANILTAGIYTPMTIQIQCAAARPGSEPTPLARAEGASLQEYMTAGVLTSAESGEPVFLKMK